MSYVCEMLGITKRFPGVLANDRVTLQVERGEIHALLGENGAGKSTLMSILFGMYRPDEGNILLNGVETRIRDPNEANAHRIGMVHQHFKLVRDFTALENIVLGVEPTRCGFLDLGDARRKLESLTERYGLKVDLDAATGRMTVGMQQRVEILKMLYRDNDLLIFDEPTAVLTPQEVDELMKIMRNLAAEGKSIVFISHKLNEIMAIADRCTVLWRGRNVGTMRVADTTKEKLSELMVGRKVSLTPEKGEQRLGEVVMSVRGLRVGGARGERAAVRDVSFDVRAGEILCVAGVDGNGQTELAAALTGLMEIEGGQILFQGERWEGKSVRYRNTHGLGHIPEDRQRFGLVLDHTLEENCVLQRYFEPRFERAGFIRRDEVRKYAEELGERFDIRSGQGAVSPARTLSGGNQQKVILAREIDRDPKLLIAVQPTRGLDIGAIEYIHGQLLALRDKGRAVLLVSLEMEEIMNISDRIMVMFDGRIVCDLRAEETTVRELGRYMAGLERE